MVSIRAKDLARVLDTVRAMNEAGDEGFERSLVTAATELVDCDSVSYNEHHLERVQELRCFVEPSYVERSPAAAHYLRHLGQHPVIAGCRVGRLAAGDCFSVSDLVTARAFHALPLYTDYFHARGVEDQLVGLVTARNAQAVMVVFSRSRRGFGRRDREVLELLVPHLQHTVRRRRRLAGLSAALTLRGPDRLDAAAWASLTTRERDVVACLASGATDQRIARVLAVSPRTVGKHLENVYRKLGIPGRVALLAALRTGSGSMPDSLAA
jgi:DNA-binding CsgD family transcriptional regulator